MRSTKRAHDVSAQAVPSTRDVRKERCPLDIVLVHKRPRRRWTGVGWCFTAAASLNLMEHTSSLMTRSSVIFCRGSSEGETCARLLPTMMVSHTADTTPFRGSVQEQDLPTTPPFSSASLAEEKEMERIRSNTLQRVQPKYASTTATNANDDGNEVSTTKATLKASIPPEVTLRHPPWILSKSQIHGLKVVELRDACAERSLIKRGRKADLQERLMRWSKAEEQNLKEASVTNLADIHPNNGIIDYRVLPLSQQQRNRKRNPGKERLDRLSNILASIKKSSAANNESRGATAKDNKDKEEDDDGYIVSEAVATPDITDNYLAQLTRTYKRNQPYSNRQIVELYNRAKKADIVGDTLTTKKLLARLHEVVPHDGRVVRRLARLYIQRGDIDSARALLQKSCQRNPENPHLWQGLAQIEYQLHRYDLACRHYHEAIAADPSFPNAYHALGRLEHKEGHIKEAMSVLQKGVRNCPSNHRLYHALGGLYIEANRMVKARDVLQKGMDCGPPYSQAFFCTSMAQVAYHLDGVDEARKWLRRGLASNSMHAQGWVALAQLEESELRYDKAREVYGEGCAVYERARERTKFVRSGDRWNILYAKWAKMEEHIGKSLLAGEVYLRASNLFPKDWSIWSRYAHLMAQEKDLFSYQQVKAVLEQACVVARTRHSYPFWQYAKYEMSLSNHQRARSIFLRGAQTVLDSFDGQERGLARLYYDWGKLEYKHMKDYITAQPLLDKALSLARSSSTPEIRKDLTSQIYFTKAQMQYSLEKYHKAHHFVCLSLYETGTNDNVGSWRLWAKILDRLKNEKLASECREQARMFQDNDVGNNLLMNESLSFITTLRDNDEFKNMLCKAPWTKKIFYNNIEEKRISYL